MLFRSENDFHSEKIKDKSSELDKLKEETNEIIIDNKKIKSNILNKYLELFEKYNKNNKDISRVKAELKYYNKMQNYDEISNLYDNYIQDLKKINLDLFVDKNKNKKKENSPVSFIIIITLLIIIVISLMYFINKPDKKKKKNKLY